jgi:hypothetical protein
MRVKNYSENNRLFAEAKALKGDIQAELRSQAKNTTEVKPTTQSPSRGNINDRINNLKS